MQELRIVQVPRQSLPIVTLSLLAHRPTISEPPKIIAIGSLHLKVLPSWRFEDLAAVQTATRPKRSNSWLPSSSRRLIPTHTVGAEDSPLEVFVAVIREILDLFPFRFDRHNISVR